MTLQTSGAISLANIQTEFSGANPIGINEYYAGGSYVPAGTSGTNGAVPSSGQISFSQFYGTASADIQTGLFISNDSSVYYGDPIGDYDFFRDHGCETLSPGTSSRISGGTWFNIEWREESGVFASYPATVSFQIRRPLAQGSIPNSGWTTATITSPAVGVTTFSRSALSFNTTSDSTYYYADWSTNVPGGVADPFLGGAFNATSVTCEVKFT